MKMIMVLCCAAFCALSVFAGGGGESAASAKETVVLQVGSEYNNTEPIGKALLKWQDLIARRGDGSLKLEIYPDSQLGGKNDLIDSMQLGEPVIVAGDPGYLADYGVPDLGILYGPFLFSNNEQCYKIVKSDWFQQTAALMETKGLKIFCANWVTGIRHILTNKPVKVPADLAGMKIRVPSNRIQTEIFRILGAAPVGMSLGEVYTALQTGTIDGGENPLSTLYSRKHFEVSKYLLMSGHERVVNMWITSSAVYNKMTPQQQELLSSTGEEVGIEYNNEQASSEKEYMQKMIQEGGVTVTEMTPELEKLFKDATRSFYDKGDMFGWSKGLYEKVLAAMK